MANLEEGELEDGELLSSGEEEEGETATGAQQVCNLIAKGLVVNFIHIWRKCLCYF